MRISDWSSDVCSSDLGGGANTKGRLPPRRARRAARPRAADCRSPRSPEPRLRRATIRAPARSDRPRNRASRGTSSEERGVGKGGGRKCRARWSPANEKKKQAVKRTIDAKGENK